MSKPSLFTVEIESDYKKPENIEIYGPTNEKYQVQKKIEVKTKLERAMIRERKERLLKAKTDFEIKEVMNDTNWKIRVLNEQRYEEEQKQEKRE
jgi:hypothetical protein